MENNHTIRNIFFFALGLGLIAGFVFYRPHIAGIWNSAQEKLVALVGNSVGDDKNTATPQPPAQMAKNCGTTVSADLKVATTYENNETLNCLGDSARTCQMARGIVQDSFFPTVFEILPSASGCNFKLSYASDSVLIDGDGNKMSGQSITCPIGTVKSMQENGNQAPMFTEPSLTNADKYGAEIYSYGTVGLFIETGLERNAVIGKGCYGSYIDSIIRSYQASEATD